MLIVALSFLFDNSLYPQVDCITVRYNCVTNLTKGKIHDGLSLLYMTSSKGLFVHAELPLNDSYRQIDNMWYRTIGDPEGLPVYTDLGAKEITYKSEYGAPSDTKIIFKEAVPSIKWKIMDRQKQIGSYLSTLATGVFGEREYVVWFTSEIPVSLGPYKLSGLPGLILEARSLDERVKYTFMGIENDCDREIAPPVDGTIMTTEEFENFIIATSLKIEAMNTADLKVHYGDPNSDSEIERNKWTIVSRFRADRAMKRQRNVKP